MATQSKAQAAPPVLFLRFACSRCQTLLQVPLTKLRGGAKRCMHCSAQVDLPELNDKVSGFAELCDATGTTCQITCPTCSAKLHAPANDLGRRRRCPGCYQWLTLAFVADGNGTPRAAANPELSGTHDRSRQSAPKQTSAAPPANAEKDKPTEVTHFHDNSAVVYSPAGDNARSSPSGPLLSPRAIGWIVWLAVQFGFPVALFFVAGRTQNTALVFVALAFCIPRLSRLVSEQITPLFLQTFRCPGCHEVYPAVSRWGCSCGYTDHREQHILRFHCPLCKSVLGHTDCKRCDSTIILR